MGTFGDAWYMSTYLILQETMYIHAMMIMQNTFMLLARQRLAQGAAPRLKTENIDLSDIKEDIMIVMKKTTGKKKDFECNFFSGVYLKLIFPIDKVFV